MAATLRRDFCRCGARRPMSAAARRRNRLATNQAELIRNYDYSPKLLEGTWLASIFLGRRVVAMSDCLWGVLDGMNEAGLAISLSFGGRPQLVTGFRHPESCDTYWNSPLTSTKRWLSLAGTGAHVLYDLDAGSRRRLRTGFRQSRPRDRGAGAPRGDQPPRQPEWTRHGAATTHSVEREIRSSQALHGGSTPNETWTFPEAPVYQTSYGMGYGTLYTASIGPPRLRSNRVAWRAWQQTCASFWQACTLSALSESALAQSADRQQVAA